MAIRETLDQLTAAVAYAELIPADRPLTAGEIELLDDLNTQLHAAPVSNRGRSSICYGASLQSAGTVTPVFASRPLNPLRKSQRGYRSRNHWAQ